MNYPNWFLIEMKALEEDFDAGLITYNEYRYALRDLNETLDEIAPVRPQFEDQYA